MIIARRNSHRFTQGFGWLNLAFALALALIAAVYPQWLPISQGLLFTLCLQLVVSLGLIFAANQLHAGTDLGRKAFPAVWVAYGLFCLMALRWLNAS